MILMPQEQYNKLILRMLSMLYAKAFGKSELIEMYEKNGIPWGEIVKGEK